MSPLPNDMGETRKQARTEKLSVHIVCPVADVPGVSPAQLQMQNSCTNSYNFLHLVWYPFPSFEKYNITLFIFVQDKSLKIVFLGRNLEFWCWKELPFAYHTKHQAPSFQSD